MTGRCLARLMVFRRVHLGPTRSRAVAVLFRRLQVRPTHPFRSTTALDRISSRRIYASPRRLGLGNRPERWPRDRAETKAASVVLAGLVEWAAAAVAGAADVVVRAAVDQEVDLAAAPVRANATTWPLASRFLTSST